MTINPPDSPSAPTVDPHWTMSHGDSAFYEIKFTQGTTLNRFLLDEIGSQYCRQNENDRIRVIVHLSGLVDVCPDVAAHLSKAPESTRLALFGNSHVDQVLSGFLMADLSTTKIAKYVTRFDDAIAFLKE